MREYTEQHYLPAATAYRERAANKGAVGRQMVDWRHSLEQKWAALHFGEVKVETRGEQHVFEVQVCLNDLDPKAVRVELYADGINGGDPVREEMKCARPLSDASRGCVFHATVPNSRPASDYTARADTSAFRGGGSARSRSNPMATVMKTSERDLHDYISEISDRTDVRAGSPLPLGTQETGGGVNFAIFSRYASRVRLELFDHPEDAAPCRDN